jgi:hypothetical protein
LPAKAGDVAELQLPRQAFRICDRNNFARPKTDYDRACAALLSADGQGVAEVRAGPGYGLVFAAVNGPLTWWEQQRMLVNGRELPSPDRLGEVRWSEGLEWTARATQFVLLNACEHGRNPGPWPRLAIGLARGRYLVQSGRYGWAGGDPVIDLFRFTLKRSRRTNE